MAFNIDKLNKIADTTKKVITNDTDSIKDAFKEFEMKYKSALEKEEFEDKLQETLEEALSDNARHMFPVILNMDATLENTRDFKVSGTLYICGSRQFSRETDIYKLESISINQLIIDVKSNGKKCINECAKATIAKLKALGLNFKVDGDLNINQKGDNVYFVDRIGYITF